MFERHASPRQIAANRLNAQKSTGPRSAEGKAVARMNALKTGIHAQSLIIYGEKAEDLETLAAEYYDHHQPATPQERLWLDILIRNEWLLRRLFAAEAQIWDHAYDRLCEPAKIPPSLGRIATAYDSPSSASSAGSTPLSATAPAPWPSSSASKNRRFQSVAPPTAQLLQSRDR